MHKIVVISLVGACLSACAYNPTLAERVHVVDSPVDTYKCRHLGDVGGPYATAQDFDVPLEAMIERTAALGGNTLYVARRSRDWSYVRGSAPVCGYVGEPPCGGKIARATVRAKG